MYLHRPDIPSFVFGLLFTLVGLRLLLPVEFAQVDFALVLGLLAVATAVAVAGSLVFGDVHARAGERHARRAVALGPPAAPYVADTHDLDPDPMTVLNDPVFGPPIDPEALDRAYRETFGDDDGPLRLSDAWDSAGAPDADATAGASAATDAAAGATDAAAGASAAPDAAAEASEAPDAPEDGSPSSPA